MANHLIRAVPNVFDCTPKSKFSLSKHLFKFESRVDAQRRRKTLVTVLKKYRPQETELIECVETCSKRNRCRLLCCPICMRILRLWFCDQVAPLVAAESFRMVTLVPDRHRHGIGTLHAFKPQHLIDDLRAALKKHRLKNVIIFGSIDYCEQRFRDHKGQYHQIWCPHLHLISNITEADWAKLRLELNRYFPRSPDVKVPVKMVRIASKGFEILKPISYCIKSTFSSNYSSVQPLQSATPPNNAAKSARSKRKKQRMSGKFQAELACAHARQRFKDRIVLIGLKHVQKSIIKTVSFRSRQRLEPNQKAQQQAFALNW